MSDIHLRFGNEATRAPNNSISGFPRLWDEEVTRPPKGRLSLSLSRQRQISRRHRSKWSVPEARITKVLGRYAEQKNPGLASDEDLQAVLANFSQPTTIRATPTSRSPASASAEEFRNTVNAAEHTGLRRERNWMQDVKGDPDGPPSYSAPTSLYGNENSPAGPAELAEAAMPAEMPDYSTTDWRLTAEERDRDPFVGAQIRPDNDPWGPAVYSGPGPANDPWGPALYPSGPGPGPTLLRVPQVSPVSRWSSSHGSSRTRASVSTSSGRSYQSMRASDAVFGSTNRPKAHRERKSTGSVRENPDMYGSG